MFCNCSVQIWTVSLRIPELAFDNTATIILDQRCDVNIRITCSSSGGRAPQQQLTKGVCLPDSLEKLRDAQGRLHFCASVATASPLRRRLLFFLSFQ